MYRKGYGIIETLAPLHVGATAGEETGNLNLIFRDQFTQTGIIPGSSIRGRLRSEVYLSGEAGKILAEDWYGRGAERNKDIEFESRIKIEHASIVWIPVFCPGQPIVWVSCPRLLMRYQRIMGDLVKVNDNKYLKDIDIPKPYTGSQDLKGRETKTNSKEVLFFNFGFLTIEKPQQDLSHWFPLDTMFTSDNSKQLPAVVVKDKEMALIHDMALYRQSRVALKKDQKVVDDRAFFNVEALPEGTVMVFPIGIKDRDMGKKDKLDWKPLNNNMKGDIYLGGLESVGFGHCYMTIKGLD
ncbi:type III-B CRISPR module RAMP protein Cmr4 [Kamptonema animale CS-326]|jgi:CRISPR-associated protein Cmr4|uniref:type III-B CRISPR module RAMP protein Cmr4 n=1 Tax=Kamptonema animale TaxID=92934 RepID=UPI00232FD4D0|nr:type III-B CRISPR module RAMP protein Cmr4 [Kamptonema animale]MDB9512833.1 type III-B CRISPR module RAMP protein Cmr4 [Kamptonema animale CS-326]